VRSRNKSKVLNKQIFFAVCSYAHLFAKLTQPGDSEVTFAVFESSCHYQSYHSKIEANQAIPLSLPKDTKSELARLSPHYPFNAERQAGKL